MKRACIILALALLGAGNPAAPNVPAPVLSVPGTSTYYNAGGPTVSDISGTGATCTLTGTPPVPGADGVDLNGSSDYILCGHQGALTFGTGAADSPFSVCAWVNMDDATSFRIVYKGTAAATIEYVFTTNPSRKLLIGVYDGGTSSSQLLISDVAYTSDENSWVQYCGTYDGRGGGNAADGMALYRNGVAVAATGFSYGSYVAMEADGDDMHLGRDVGPGYANGGIAGVTIWPAALTAAQIKHEHDKGRPQGRAIGTVASGAPAAKLVAHWPLDSTNRQSATDASELVNGLHLTGYGTPNFALDPTAVNLNDAVPQYLRADTLAGNAIDFGNGTSDDPFSVSLWVNPDAAANDFWVYRRAPASDLQWSLFQYSEPRVRFTLKDPSAGVQAQAECIDPDIAYTQWSHVVATYDGGGGATAANGMTIYIDGEPCTAYYKDNNASYVAMESGDGYIEVGSALAGTSSPYDGYLDDLRIYSGVLTAAEAKRLYQQDRNSISSLAASSLDKGLVFHLPCYQPFNTTGAIPTNRSGYGYSISAVGTPTVESDHCYTDDASNEEWLIVDSEAALPVGDGATDAPFTLAYWLWKDDTGQNDTGLQFMDDTANIRWQSFHASGGQFRGALFDTSEGSRIGYQCTTQFTTNDTWHHYAFIYSGSGAATGIDLFVDGVECAYGGFSSGSFTSTEPPATPTLYIAGGAGTNYQASGKWRDIRAYDRVISTAELAELVACGYDGCN